MKRQILAAPFIILALIVMAEGCQISKPLARGNSVTETTSQAPIQDSKRTATTNPLSLTNRFGLSLHDAQDKSLKLIPGMTKDDVTLLLGTPDTTSAGTYGTETPQPWNGMTWCYRWTGASQMLVSSLLITFEKEQNDWVVHGWQWY